MTRARDNPIVNALRATGMRDLDEAFGVIRATPPGFIKVTSMRLFLQGSDQWYEYVNGNTTDWTPVYKD